MSRKKMLFVSWQGGLGHVTRDLAIAQELHNRSPEVEINWLANPLSAKMIEKAKEKILPDSEQSADYNKAAAEAITGFKLNLVKFVRLSNKMFVHNAELFKQVISKHDFDLIVGDESFEVVVDVSSHKIQLGCKMLMIEDFIAMASTTSNPLEKLGVYRMNRRKVKDMPHSSDNGLTHCFVGEPEDVPDRDFGLFLPNQREFAKKYYEFLGYIVRFDPADYSNKEAAKAKLGYGDEPLIICATGGTAAGIEMLEKCGKAFTLLKNEIPRLRMICVCGDLYGRKKPELPPGIEVQGLVPNLYEHYAACDMAVVIGGMTTTIELTALRRPFIYFPLENQFDQQFYVSARLTRFGAGIKMKYFDTTPENLAQTIKANIRKEVQYPPISLNGAKRSAELINNYLAAT
jgi:UDP-N-acetylglucosamine:LPS N-acetylglucosamine transferase